MAATKLLFSRPFSAHLLRHWSQKSCINATAKRNVSQVPLGFIGLGNMGSHMAKNLIKAGHRLVVYDVYPEAIEALSKMGAVPVQSPADVAGQCDNIITMLPSSPHVTAVYAGQRGILSNIKSGSLLIDSSTIDPSVSQDMAKLAEAKGATFIDAPVSGGVNAARDGTLTFMVGGKESEGKAAEEVLLCMGKNVIHCGSVGCGQAAKICNNMMLAISMIGCAETMNLGARLGLDPSVLNSILNVSSGKTWPSEVYSPVPGVMPNVPSSNNYNGGFGTALMTKDLGLAQTAATNTNSPTPLGSVSHQIYRLLLSKGLGQKDFSVVYQLIREGGLPNE
ncbi:3-hydroxyisobutyrate dehydrogenase, mitochondrial-like [Ornithodoros turicata]|uniref:3-hydroxyisobutyrate dehydrogenase, mitochondrial-like n=1 Tax=Ornithodoros turicata TaxID=34597 RepID=UPI003139553A